MTNCVKIICNFSPPPQVLLVFICLTRTNLAFNHRDFNLQLKTFHSPSFFTMDTDNEDKTLTKKAEETTLGDTLPFITDNSVVEEVGHIKENEKVKDSGMKTKPRSDIVYKWRAVHPTTNIVNNTKENYLKTNVIKYIKKPLMNSLKVEPKKKDKLPTVESSRNIQFPPWGGKESKGYDGILLTTPPPQRTVRYVYTYKRDQNSSYRSEQNTTVMAPEDSKVSNVQETDARVQEEGDMMYQEPRGDNKSNGSGDRSQESQELGDKGSVLPTYPPLSYSRPSHQCKVKVL